MSACSQCGQEVQRATTEPSCSECAGTRLVPAVPGEAGARKLDLLLWVKSCPSCLPAAPSEKEQTQ